VTEPALLIDRLTVTIGGRAVIEDVSLAIAPGELVGLVGESGCGKSVTALAVMGLLPAPAARVLSGRCVVGGTEVTALGPAALRRLQGERMAMIFQEPMTALNPVLAVGEQVAEPLMIHRAMARRAALDRAAELLALVGIPGGRKALERFPHQLSGGQRQRVMIAMALACEPRLLVADEPTTALDVTVQAQILDLIDRLRRDLGTAVLLITHDLGVVSEVADRVAVMYAGRIVETGPALAVMTAPRHRYTRALLDTIPAANAPGTRLPAIPGQVPPPGRRPAGCAFAPRCGLPEERCGAERPDLDGGAHAVACWRPAA
jgi:oligopeptide/dipeptide ABC transporter ATP-binding protein